MSSMLVHIKVRAGQAPRFETVLKDLTAHTPAHEPGCLRYEYWRGASENQHYAFLAFVDGRAFYEHQASEYHEQYLEALLNMFETFSIENVDPIEAGGSGLPATVDSPLGLDPEGRLGVQKQRYPISVQAWWERVRTHAG